MSLELHTKGTEKSNAFLNLRQLDPSPLLISGITTQYKGS